MAITDWDSFRQVAALGYADGILCLASIEIVERSNRPSVIVPLNGADAGRAVKLLVDGALFRLHIFAVRAFDQPGRDGDDLNLRAAVNFLRLHLGEEQVAWHKERLQGARAQRVDVFGCIARMGAMLMFQPLEPLLGAFIREEGVAGIILSTRRPLGMQRFTAAHELGHLFLGHDPHADDEGILRRAPWANDAARGPTVPPEEREADAFASYFLLPPYLIKEQMELRGWEPRHFVQPETVYQASLRFGTSYRATVFALEREHVIGRSLGQQLRNAEPRDLKRQLLGDYALKNAQRVDVWHLTERDEGAVIEASRDDLFLLRLKEDSGSGYVWTFDELRDAGFAIHTAHHARSEAGSRAYP